MSAIPTQLAMIAGRGAYPRLLAESAKSQGVERLTAVAFKGETDRRIEQAVDDTHWINLGKLDALLDALRKTGAKHAVMAGQITPTHLFRLRLDAAMVALLKSLPSRNAHTIFGAIGDQLRAIGIDLLPASTFMEAHMPAAGVLTTRAPDEREQADIDMGVEVARATSHLDIGQTVVIKEGTILAVEAFEGTDAAIKRAAQLGGKGVVVVKLAKRGHDMRFDIPVVGDRTVKTLHRAGAGALAVEAGRAILLERDRIIESANRCGLAVVALEPVDASTQ